MSAAELDDHHVDRHVVIGVGDEAGLGQLGPEAALVRKVSAGEKVQILVLWQPTPVGTWAGTGHGAECVGRMLQWGQ